MPFSKRECAAAILAKSGILQILERVAPRRPCLLVWNYHRIGNREGNMLDEGVFSATSEVFEAQVQYLSDHFTVVGLHDLLFVPDRAFSVHKPCAMVTFDDGYCDNFQVALPILERLGVKATFFLPTKYIGQSLLPWWDRIAYVVKATRETHLAINYPLALNIDLRQTRRCDAIDLLLQVYKRHSVDEHRFFEHLHDATQTSLPGQLANGVFMSWDQVRELVAKGMSIGSHTHTHSLLSQMSEAERSREFTLSKQLLEHELGEPISAVSYPVGDRSECDDEIKSLAQKAGYRLGFSFYGGVNYRGHTDLLNICRLSLGYDMSLALFRVRSTLFSTIGHSI